MIKKFVWRSFFDDLPLVHEDDAVRDRSGKAHLVRHAEHGQALARQLDHHAEHFLNHLGVERRGGFVEQHDVRLEAKRARDRHALLLAARQLQWIFAGLIGDAHALELLHGPLMRFGLRDIVDPHRGQCQVVQNSQVREQVELLEHHAHPPAHGMNCTLVATEFMASDDEPPLLMALQAVDAANQRRLARTRRPADHDSLTARHRQVDVSQCMKSVAIPLVDFGEVDDGFCHRGGCHRERCRSSHKLYRDIAKQKTK